MAIKSLIVIALIASIAIAEELDNKVVESCIGAECKNETSPVETSPAPLADNGTTITTTIEALNSTSPIPAVLASNISDVCDHYNLTEKDRCEIRDRLRNDSEIRDLLRNLTSAEYLKVLAFDLEPRNESIVDEKLNGSSIPVVDEMKKNSTESLVNNEEKPTNAPLTNCAETICHDWYNCLERAPKANPKCSEKPMTCCGYPSCLCAFPPKVEKN